MFDDQWKAQLETLGSFIRAQRRLANLTLRDMADLANVSNPYLSQIERGLHEPSVRVLKAIAGALDLSAETLLQQAGMLEADAHDADPEADPDAGHGDPHAAPKDPRAASMPDTETAIRSDQKLSDDQKEALIAVYRGFLATKPQN